MIYDVKCHVRAVGRGATFEIMAEFSEVDTTTLTPTDLSTTLSITLDSSKSRSSSSKGRLDITRDELERKQLLHTIQLLKLELSQKQLVIDTSHNEQASQIEELREFLADAQHEKKLLSLRLQSLSHGYEQELKRAREKLCEERNRVCREITVQRSSETVIDGIRQNVEQALTMCPLLDEFQYQHLKVADSASLPVEDFVRLRLHENIKTFQKQSSDLQRTVDVLNRQIRDGENAFALSEENLAQEKERVQNLQEECSSLAHELKVVKLQVREGNYKVDNFDSVKRERDALRKEVEGMRTTLAGAKGKDKLAVEELDKLTKELSASQQSEALLCQDKDYLSRQVSELTQKLSLTEESLKSLSEELAAAKQAKEGLYQQLIKSREEKHMECDRRLEAELEGLRARTTLEVDQLRVQTREMYERENKVLREARDCAVSERDRAKAAEKEANEKHESLLKEYHSLHGSSDKHLVEVQGELQVVRFEKERIGLVHQETLKDHRHMQLEQEKLRKKVELLSQELRATESSKEMQVKSLEEKLHNTQQQLEGYEKIEKELDDIVMQSAQMEHSCDAERVLFSYGFGTSVPAHSRRRLQQSVHLARRVLQLEKINLSLREQLKREEEKASQLKEEMACCQELLESSQQPHGYLMSRVKEQKAQLQASREKVSKLEAELASVKREKSILIETKNQLAADLERLLNHREELQLMKAMLLGSNGPQQQQWVANKPVALHGPPNNTAQPSDSSHQPHPTVFTKHLH